MVFSSLLFLYAFLPLFLAAYFLAPARRRNAVALGGSLVFYGWGEPRFLPWLVATGIFDYGLSRLLARTPALPPGRRRALLILGLAGNLGALAYFKYANFLVAQLNAAFGWAHVSPLAWSAVLLPLGISFFTFHKISYLVDVYRGEVRPTDRIADHLLYILLFPQLVAGPIVRFRDIAGQLRDRAPSAPEFLAGLWRFTLGLARKVLVANPLGATADRLFAADPGTLTGPLAWLALLAYAFQIYFDFAGYSDMALGLARMLGFTFPENFDRPYVARSVTEFWRRWHLSLSAFMRDYLYVPLGGNRVGPWRRGFNLWLVFLASGLWHGASWNFVLWGGYHGALLTAEKLAGPRLARVPAWLAVPLTFGLVLFGWALFRSEDLPRTAAFLARLVAPGAWTLAPPNLDLIWPLVLPHRTATVLVLAAVASFAPAAWWRRFAWLDCADLDNRRLVLRFAAGVVLLVFASAAIADATHNPFIYFRF